MTPAIELIPSRIRYYLLDYKDANIEDYRSEFGTKSTRSLNREELARFFSLAVKKDIEKIDFTTTLKF